MNGDEDFERVKNCLVCRLVNYRANRELLEKIPHTRFLDLAMIYFYEMETEGENSGILVRDRHLKLWGIRIEQLHTAAIRNTRARHPFQLSSISQIIEQLLFGFAVSDGNEPLSLILGDPQILVLSNRELKFGAVNICFPDIWEEISRLTDGDFYVLPSSIHECIILPVSEWGEEKRMKLQMIVREINTGFTVPEEILGSSVYRYSSEKHALEVAA